MASNNMINALNRIKLNLFKKQDLETGLFDVIFEVGGKVIYAHKNMLNLVSPTFASMLSERWIKNKDVPIKIKDYSYDDFKQFLTFLYSGECQLTETNICKMVDMAEFYAVDLFKTYCDDYLSKMEITTQNIFQLMDFANKYSMAQLKSSVLTFIIGNFQSFAECDGFLKADKSFIEELIAAVKDKVKPEDLFQGIYNWCEKQAIAKQADDSTLNVNDAIKTEITDFLPHINFLQMELLFFSEFVVPRGFIFSSYKELSQILSDRLSKPIVTITNDLGQTLHGNLIPDKTVINNVKSLFNQSSYGSNWWNTKFKRPSTPSPLKQNEDVQWYLIYFSDGDIGIKLCAEIRGNDYLLAELTPGPSGFQIAKSFKIEIE